MVEHDYAGTGIRWPLRVTPEGDLALVSGEKSIWQAIDILLRNPEPPPLDPRFAMDVDAYEPMRDAYRIAQHIAETISANETRIDALRVTSAHYDAEDRRLDVRIEITPRGAATSQTRVFPFWTHKA